jgi:hypothetical protein
MGVKYFAHVQTGPAAHPSSCTMGTGSFPGVKRPDRGADHPPLPTPRLRVIGSITLLPLWPLVPFHRTLSQSTAIPLLRIWPLVPFHRTVTLYSYNSAPPLALGALSPNTVTPYSYTTAPPLALGALSPNTVTLHMHNKPTNAHRQSVGPFVY